MTRKPRQGYRRTYKDGTKGPFVEASLEELLEYAETIEPGCSRRVLEDLMFHHISQANSRWSSWSTVRELIMNSWRRKK